jgi:hypothetical protein
MLILNSGENKIILIKLLPKINWLKMFQMRS